jgi:hypothetical protein
MAGKSYKLIQRTYTLEEAWDEAFSEIEGLAEEIRSWYDNLQGTNFENSDRASMLDDAATTLENVYRPDCPEAIKDIQVVCLVSVPKSKRQGTSRAVRLENALTLIQDISSVIEDEDNMKEQIKKYLEASGNEYKTEEDLESAIQEAYDEASSFKDDIDGVYGDLDGSVEFPTMRG